MRKSIAALAVVIIAGGAIVGGGRWMRDKLGRQTDGSFLVSSGQHVEAGAMAFAGRPIDLALHPDGKTFAILNRDAVLLATRTGVIDGSAVPLGRKITAAFRGLCWTPDGSRLFASTAAGHVQELRYANGRLALGAKLNPAPEGEKDNAVPGGMCVTAAGDRLYVAAANRNAIVEFDLTTNMRRRELRTQVLPFEPRLTEDEKTLVVSNWGGRPPKPGERAGRSQHQMLLVDERGAPASGTLSLIDRETGDSRHVEIGIHPSGIAIAGTTAYVACAHSDSVAVVDLAEAKLQKSIPIQWGERRIFGSMPNALAHRDGRLYVCSGGDNALAVVDLAAGKTIGFHPVGYFPVAVALLPDGSALVLNTKGNGSVQKTSRGIAGNAHDFQGSVSVVKLDETGLAVATSIVARNNRWDEGTKTSPLKVYNGAIKNVLYIIKENRTYDEVFGDLPMGNGDPKLCSLGEKVMPNHRKLAREFTLFDNGYVSGTNSADGHAWCTQCLANDYLERFYVGYSRTYPDDGDCAMALAPSGHLWDAAAKKGRSIRVWGEFCDDKLARIEPKPKDWFEVWEDRKIGGKKFKFTADTAVPGLKPFINREVHYWPLFMSDQHRADVFIREYKEFSAKDTVPNLMIVSLPCDHGEGTDPLYPTPRAMMADNDLALGRIVEAVSASPQWKETCIFVIEDDAQSGPDHVDGHRSVFMAISPYTRRKFVDSTLYVQTNMFRSMEMMLGIDPLNKFDACAYPMEACFSDAADLTPYQAAANNTPLDERNPGMAEMTPQDRFWYEKTKSLDWSRLDGPDPYWLNRINWYSIFKGARPYPAREGEEPGEAEGDDD